MFPNTKLSNKIKKKDTEINTKTVVLKENEKKDIKTDMMCIT